MIEVNLQTMTARRAAIPAELVGLSQDTLRNLQTELNPVPEQFANVEYWPDVDETPEFDADTHGRGEEMLVPDMDTKTVKVIGTVVVLPPDTVQAKMAAIDSDLSARIDSLIAAIYAGPQRFIKEYEEREAQARDFIARNGVGEVPARIAAFAAASGLAPLSAAQLTVQQADNLRAALGQLADLRMRKYEIKRAPNRAAKQAVFDDIQAKAQAIAKTIG